MSTAVVDERDDHRSKFSNLSSWKVGKFTAMIISLIYIISFICTGIRGGHGFESR